MRIIEMILKSKTVENELAEQHSHEIVARIINMYVCKKVCAASIHEESEKKIHNDCDNENDHI